MFGISVLGQGHAAGEGTVRAFPYFLGLLVLRLFLLFAGDGEHTIAYFKLHGLRGNAGQFDLHGISLVITRDIEARQEIGLHLERLAFKERRREEIIEHLIHFVMQTGKTIEISLHCRGLGGSLILSVKRSHNNNLHISERSRRAESDAGRIRLEHVRPALSLLPYKNMSYCQFRENEPPEGGTFSLGSLNRNLPDLGLIRRLPRDGDGQDAVLRSGGDVFGISILGQGHAAGEGTVRAFPYFLGLFVLRFFLLLAGDGEHAVVHFKLHGFGGNAGQFDLHGISLVITRDIEARQEIGLHLEGLAFKE